MGPPSNPLLRVSRKRDSPADNGLGWDDETSHSPNHTPVTAISAKFSPDERAGPRSPRHCPRLLHRRGPQGVLRPFWLVTSHHCVDNLVLACWKIEGATTDTLLEEVTTPKI